MPVEQGIVTGGFKCEWQAAVWEHWSEDRSPRRIEGVMPSCHRFAALLLVLCFGTLCHGQSRTFSIVNNCADTLWISMTSGAAPYSRNVAQCSDDSDCMLGSSCADNRICYWNVPTPSSGSFRLAPTEKTNITFPYLDSAATIYWSGAISACLNGTCSKDVTTCDAQGCGVANASPETRAEFTLSKTGTDFYDIEVINGFNIPVQIEPQTDYVKPNDPYTCGNPGSATPRTGAGACAWQFKPPSAHYYWVAAGGINCTSSSDCPSDQMCGLSNTPGVPDRLRMRCGKHLGYWTANQICGVQGTYGAPINCKDPLPAPLPTDKIMSDLYGCGGGIPSCYSKNVGSGCCGCVDWNTTGLDVPANTAQCANSNPTWLDKVKPTLFFLKQACPTAYTYPYDDMSSTFVCSEMANGINVLNYVIHMCPKSNNGGTWSLPMTYTPAMNDGPSLAGQIAPISKSRGANSIGFEWTLVLLSVVSLWYSA